MLKYKTSTIFPSLQVRKAIGTEVVWMILSNMIRVDKNTAGYILKGAIILPMFLPSAPHTLNDVIN